MGGICCYMSVNVCAAKCVRVCGWPEVDLRGPCVIALDFCVLTQGLSWLAGQ